VHFYDQDDTKTRQVSLYQIIAQHYNIGKIVNCTLIGKINYPIGKQKRQSCRYKFDLILKYYWHMTLQEPIHIDFNFSFINFELPFEKIKNIYWTMRGDGISILTEKNNIYHLELVQDKR